ncbi:MAG: hypothetical protein HXY42_05580 [Chloroflexi bacterium]|nr:hypothetical protein [Chloroflexota bacterium]
MNVVQPSRLAFWRFVLGGSAALPFLSIGQVIALGRALEVDILLRPSWMGLVAGLSLLGVLPLLAWTLTWSRHRERILALAEFPERAPAGMRWAGWALLTISLFGYTALFSLPYIRGLLGDEGWFKLLVFWLLALAGTIAFKLIRRDAPWFPSLLGVILAQAAAHLIVVNFSRVTDYPFALGWSETSRYYYPSLFLSEIVYGQKYPLPILHPTLHLLLAPPYLFEAPIWVHRLWQALIRLALVGAIVPAMLKRLSVQGRELRWLIGLGIFLYLFMGPLYFHLAVPIILVLYGYSGEDDRKTWIAVLLASLWCGWSRVNWYPVPGMLAAVLYLLEVPQQGKNLRAYLFKPALWFLVGTLTAFVFQKAYVAIAGVPSELFYTSLSSALLWHRLLPNASYFLGLLPAALLASAPMWLVMYTALRHRGEGWSSIRLALLFAALFTLFLGGLVVSLKIGGGTDLHNMDAYFILLLIVTGYLAFARYRREDGAFDPPVPIHWTMLILLTLMPVWSQWRVGTRFVSYDAERTRPVLSALQERVDQVRAQGGEVLFITQRHLLSMKMLEGVSLVPEYEREDLMEMAMANHLAYLGRFQHEMDSQRFDLIVVDPLNYNYLAGDRSFAEENNVWVKYAVRPILCNYRAEVIFPEDEIALYVPREGGQQCP